MAETVHVIVRVKIPDRPGALGAVASRIGSVGADIVDVHVAGRGGGLAEDVFHLQLPVDESGIDVVGVLLAEIAQVDGTHTPSISYPSEPCCA